MAITDNFTQIKASCTEPSKGQNLSLKLYTSYSDERHPLPCLNIIEPRLMEQLLILANARTNANHGQSLFMPYQFRLDCHVGIAKTLALAASGDVRGRLANEGIGRPALQIEQLYSQGSHGLPLQPIVLPIFHTSVFKRNRTVLPLKTAQRGELHPSCIVKKHATLTGYPSAVNRRRYL